MFFISTLKREKSNLYFSIFRELYENVDGIIKL